MPKLYLSDSLSFSCLFRWTIAGDENDGRLGFSRLVIRSRRPLSFSDPRFYCVITSFDTTTSGSAKHLFPRFPAISADDSGRRERRTIGILSTLSRRSEAKTDRYPLSSPVIVNRVPVFIASLHFLILSRLILSKLSISEAPSFSCLFGAKQHTLYPITID